jgi:hypothetical protein
MKKLRFWLTGLLFIQLLLAVALLWSNQWEAKQNQPKPLLNIDWQAIDKIAIRDKKTGFSAVKSGETWLLSDIEILADKESLGELLRNLQRLQTSWPVATSPNSHKRFEVAEDKFVRRIQLYSGNDLVGELFLGSAPGLRQSHARITGSDSIYTVELDTLNILPSRNQWIDKALIAAKNIISIQGPDYNLKKTGLSWSFNRSGPSIFLGNTDLGKINQDKVDELAGALSNLRIQRVANTAAEINSALTDKVTLIVSDGENRWIYELLEYGANHFIRRSDIDVLFSVERDVYEEISNVRQADLILAKPDTSGEPAAGATEATKS